MVSLCSINIVRKLLVLSVIDTDIKLLVLSVIDTDKEMYQFLSVIEIGINVYRFNSIGFNLEKNTHGVSMW